MLKPRMFFVPVILVTLPATVLLGVQAILPNSMGAGPSLVHPRGQAPFGPIASIPGITSDAGF
jgi:hypothetical protein